MAIFKIPLLPQNQKLSVNLNGITYILRIQWNAVSLCWVMDINDANDVPLLRGVPLVTGGNLLEQFEYLGIGSGIKMVVATIGPGHSPDEVPTYADLGAEGNLYYEVP